MNTTDSGGIKDMPLWHYYLAKLFSLKNKRLIINRLTTLNPKETKCSIPYIKIKIKLKNISKRIRITALLKKIRKKLIIP
jgi:hypothetical protein